MYRFPDGDDYDGRSMSKEGTDTHYYDYVVSLRVGMVYYCTESILWYSL